MERLIRQAKKGDKNAIRQLLYENRQLIESVMYRFLWDKNESEDVMQNIGMKVVLAIEDFKGNCRFSTWVYRIAVNECVEVNRRSKSNDARIALSERGMDLFPDLNAKDGFHATSDREIREIIDRAVSELPEGMREAFDVFYKRQYSGAEAARLLNITEKAFYVRLSAARNRLRDELIKKGVVYVA